MRGNEDIVFPQSEPQYNFTEGPNRAQRRKDQTERFRGRRWIFKLQRRMSPSVMRRYGDTLSELQKAILSTLRSESFFKNASPAKRSRIANQLARSMKWDGKKFNVVIA